MTLRAYVVDDEPLAVQRLVTLLRRTGRVEIAGSATDPVEALAALSAGPPPDVLFLDIHMPELDGFELLARLPSPPAVVFTTAHDEHALRAFRARALDYLLKPVTRAELDGALDRVARLAGAAAPPPGGADLAAILELVRGARPPARIASRLGDRVTLLALDDISHFVAADRLTYAVSGGRQHVLDETLTALERRLGDSRFFRVHRNALVNLDLVAELRGDGGAVTVVLRDPGATCLPVARDRVRALKDRLGI